jgi:hypothetical protein
MKVLKFFVVLLGAFIVLRLAACTTGLIPRPEDLQPESSQAESTRQAEREPDQPSGDVPEEFQQADQARQAALAFLQRSYPQDFVGLPDLNSLAWQAENVTPPDLLGSVTVEFRAEDWLVTVNYPVVAPDQVQYRVTVANPERNFYWEGRFNASLEIVSE